MAEECCEQAIAHEEEKNVLDYLFLDLLFVRINFSTKKLAKMKCRFLLTKQTNITLINYIEMDEKLDFLS